MGITYERILSYLIGNLNKREEQSTCLILTDECVSLLQVNVTDMIFLNNYLSSITALCKRHKVKKLFVFGSVLTNKFTDKSDIDLVVDFENIPVEDYADNYFSLKDALSAMFHRDIDLLEDKAIRNPILRRNIDNSKLLIYG